MADQKHPDPKQQPPHGQAPPPPQPTQLPAPPNPQTDDPTLAQQQAAQQPHVAGATSPTQAVLPYAAQTGGKGGTLVPSDLRGLPGDPAVPGNQVGAQIPSSGVDQQHPMGQPAHRPSFAQATAVHVPTPEQVKLEGSARAEWAQIKAGEHAATKQAHEAAAGQTRSLQAAAQVEAEQQAFAQAQAASSEAQKTMSPQAAQKSVEEAQALAAMRTPEAQKEALTGKGKGSSVTQQIETEREESAKRFAEEAEGDKKLHALKQEADQAQAAAANKPGDQKLRAEADKKQKAYTDAVAEAEKK